MDLTLEIYALLFFEFPYTSIVFRPECYYSIVADYETFWAIKSMVEVLLVLLRAIDLSSTQLHHTQVIYDWAKREIERAKNGQMTNVRSAQYIKQKPNV